MRRARLERSAIDLTTLLREVPQASAALQPPSDAAVRWLTVDPAVQIATISEGAMQ